MLDSLNDSIRRHLADNIWIYLVIIIALILGISLGAVTVNNIDEVSRADATTYVEGFLELTSGNELQSSQILRQSIKFNLYFSLLMFLSGLTYLGVAFIPMFVAFRGFCIGFSVAFLAGNIGNGGLLLSISSVLPQNIIYIPVIIIMGAVGMNYSLHTFRNKYFKKYGAMNNLFAAYAFTSFVLFIILIGGCIVESYITALIIKAITPYVI